MREVLAKHGTPLEALNKAFPKNRKLIQPDPTEL